MPVPVLDPPAAKETAAPSPAAVAALDPAWPGRWPELARKLALEFAATAVERDRENRAPLVEIERLRETGLVNLLIPQEWGGEGGTLRDAAHVILELARIDASIAAVLAFHYYNSLIPRCLDYQGDGEAVVRRSAKHRWLWGNVTQYVNKEFFAEPQVDGSWLVNGTKKWNTGAPLADVTTVLAVHGNRQHYVYFHIPTDRQGLKFHDDWDQVGLRGADSGTITFENVRIEAGELLPWTHADVQVGPAPFWATFGGIFYSSIYVGSAIGILDHAKDYARNRRRQHVSPGAASIAEDPLVQHQYGSLSLQVRAASALLEESIGKLQDAWDRRRTITQEENGKVMLSVLATRAFTAEVALEITPKIYDFGGGSATGNRHGFDRYWRDVRMLSVHDPLVYSIRHLGDTLLNDRPFQFKRAFGPKLA